ncbi:hypothetical protein NPIL_151821 [Nephila pilipes]|uniref:Uncharacterized protein n=1 Tax=Nephila pilipes TaxID=299642 RepID=A0A8X6P4T8_NEPPI|nr:hypothetical protein NPIL_151821 [Nephila pilipes]
MPQMASEDEAKTGKCMLWPKGIILMVVSHRCSKNIQVQDEEFISSKNSSLPRLGKVVLACICSRVWILLPAVTDRFYRSSSSEYACSFSNVLRQATAVQNRIKGTDEATPRFQQNRIPIFCEETFDTKLQTSIAEWLNFRT